MAFVPFLSAACRTTLAHETPTLTPVIPEAHFFLHGRDRLAFLLFLCTLTPSE
jgi:hypothetical protein